MLRETSAGAVVFRRSKAGLEFLLLHYALGHWDFPKGHIDPGETEEETARREIEEETGIHRLKFVESFHETITYFYRQHGRKIFKTVVYFLVETRQKRIRLSNEHQGHDWLEFEQALRRLTFSNSKGVLKKAVKKVQI